ncbi:MAG: hypothetical protein PHF46_04830 [Candidatus Gracilibacteria bacterium]|nr:hypothetical protein [Candidatus Gracilibacteria bacterium]
MKKIFFLVLAFMAFAQSTSALEFYSQCSSVFNANDGQRTLPMITIKASSGDEIKKDKGISILIPEDYFFRFDYKSLKNISIDGSAKTSVGTGITISKNLRTLFISVNTNFKALEYITISGLGIIVYNREQGFRGLGIDINGNGTAFAYEPNGIRIDNSDPRRDVWAPYEVFNMTGSLSSKKINLNWINPGEYDLEGVKIEFYNKNNNQIKEEFVYGTVNTFSFEDNIDYAYLKIKTGDVSKNYSEGIVFDLDKLRNETILSGSGITIIGSGTISNTNSGTSAGSGIISGTGSVKVGTINSGISSLKKKYISKLISLSKSTKIIDDYINKKKKFGISITKENSLIDRRNNLIMLFETYYTEPLKRVSVIQLLKVEIAKLNVELKNQ